MPTPFSHAAVGFAIAAWTQPGAPTRRVCVLAAACAVLPDVDIVVYPLHLSNASFFAHRAITHSVVFALIGAVLATIVFFRSDQWTHRRTRIALILGLAVLSHSCLDALTSYSRGVEFLAPFSQQRFRFLWTPLGLAGQPVQELVFVLLPAILIGWLGVRMRSPRAAPPTPSP